MAKTSASPQASPSWREGMGQHHVDHQHQDEGVPGLRAQQVLLCYVVTWTLYNTPTKSADSTPSTWAASEGFWASCLAQAGVPSMFALLSQRAGLDWPCQLHGGREHSQGYTLLRDCYWN